MSPFALLLEPTVPEASEAPGELPARLQACARYLSLLAEQLDAGKRHDAARLRELAAERRRLEAELGIGEPEGDSPSTPPLRALLALLEAGLAEVSREAAHDQQSWEHWATLQDEARVAARAVPAQRLGRYAAPGPMDVRLDLRL